MEPDSFQSPSLAGNASVPLQNTFLIILASFISIGQFYWSTVRSYRFFMRNVVLNFQLTGQRGWPHWRAMDPQQLRLSLANPAFTGFKTL